MPFSARITRVPEPFERDRAAETMSLIGEVPDQVRDLAVLVVEIQRGFQFLRLFHG